jgi:hypothetical protein
MSKWRALRLSRLAKARAAYGLGGGIPAYSRHELDLGFYVERGNLVGDAKRKPYKWRPRRGKVAMHRRGADHPVVVRKRL